LNKIASRIKLKIKWFGLFLSDFLPAPEGAGLPDSSNTFGFIHRLEFDTVRAYCVVA
jgi:hypothetical protein